MRVTRILIVALVLFIVIAVGAYFLLSGGGGGGATPTTAGGPDGSASAGQTAPAAQEPGLPPPTPTPAIQFVDVVAAAEDIPMGTRLTPEMLALVRRPDSNIAVVAGVSHADPSLLVGQFARTDIAAGQEILSPMLGLVATDMGAAGSDLSLYVSQGQVAVAFPISSFTGVAYSMRPGDLVDVVMSLTMIQVDPEFRSALPNSSERVDQQALLEGQSFLFPATGQGRLELIPELNLVAEILPGTDGSPLSRQVTQLTIQRAEVLWVGSWGPTPPALTRAAPPPEAEESVEGDASGLDDGIAPVQTTVRTQPTAYRPDVVILSLSAQDALALKWAQETGVHLNLALRSQGDSSTFVTASVSLPLSVEQSILTIPEGGDFDLETRFEEAPIPFLPPAPPTP